MRKEIADAVAEDAKRLDEMYYELGDTLDVKASIILVLAAFLGTVSGQVLTLPNLSWSIEVLQSLSVLSLGFCAVLTVLCLRIREFDGPPSPEQWAESLYTWSEHYAKYPTGDDDMLEHFEIEQKNLTSERIAENRKLAEEKAKMNRLALWATAAALGFEFLSLALVAYRAIAAH
ncbi:MAG: hypothetical protein WAN14_05540 [Candidatus Acidiferrales bacterium]